MEATQRPTGDEGSLRGRHGDSAGLIKEGRERGEREVLTGYFGCLFWTSHAEVGDLLSMKQLGVSNEKALGTRNYFHTCRCVAETPKSISISGQLKMFWIFSFVGFVAPLGPFKFRLLLKEKLKSLKQLTDRFIKWIKVLQMRWVRSYIKQNASIVPQWPKKRGKAFPERQHSTEEKWIWQLHYNILYFFKQTLLSIHSHYHT